MNKQQYLAARSQWKADYTALQQQIRASKQAVRDAHRALGLCGPYMTGYNANNTKWIEAHREVCNALRARTAAQDAMSDHLVALGKLKDEARKAWDAREAAMA